MTKISGYEDCHIVNEKSCKICCGAGYTYEPERYEDGSISRTVYQVPCECIKNGGEIRQGECAVALDMDSPSFPTYTREELCHIAAKAVFGFARIPECSVMMPAIDALIALGAVRVK